MSCMKGHRKNFSRVYFDGKKQKGFGVRFDTKQETGSSGEGTARFIYSVLNLSQNARHFRTTDDQKRSICPQMPAALS